MNPCDLTSDSFYQGAVTLHQPKAGYRFGTDAMLLAGCVALTPGQQILELGCGVGAVLHALAFRARRDAIAAVRLTGIELQPAMADLARQNAAANGFDLKIITGDLTDKSWLEQLGTFDHVICNPPYHPTACSTQAGNDCRSTAHIETDNGLQEWIQAANRFLKPKGTFSMIHRADRLHDYLPLCQRFLGQLTIIPFWPKAGEPARRLVIQGRKGSRAGLVLHPGVVLHDDRDGHYTAVAEAVICQGQSLASALH